MNANVTDLSAVRAARDAAAAESSVDAAYTVAIRMLGARGLTSGALAEKLRGKEYEADVTDAVVARLTEHGYLDDERFALDAIERLRTRKHLGTAALRQELRRMRLPRDVIDAALEAAAADAPDAIELAVAAARGRVERLRGLEPDVARRRLAGFLQRKGHAAAVVAIAIERTLHMNEHRGPGVARVQFEPTGE